MRAETKPCFLSTHSTSKAQHFHRGRMTIIVAPLNPRVRVTEISGELNVFWARVLPGLPGKASAQMRFAYDAAGKPENFQ